VFADKRPAGIDPAIIRESFVATSDGFSSDELLLQDPLRDAFLQEVSRRLGHPLDGGQQRSALLKLLGLRKAGKLNHPATRRSRPSDDSVFAVAEIASRAVMDRHRVTSDTILADPELRAELKSEAERIDPGVDLYQVRKAVLSLRKRRQLKPELVLKAVDWSRQVQSMQIAELKERLRADAISKGPGIYLFRDVSGYLYVGEADNLAARLSQHVKGSDRASLADYLGQHGGDEISVELHIFPKDSPAAKVTARRAYESELIRSREPKFNVRP
tara:strand:+ start:337679 stop:338497 length:819 start_codon:yes stop_codon:yes gene_type:complete